MAVFPHKQYVNPTFGLIHHCPVRDVYIKDSELKKGKCPCGKKVKK